jgi:hypothetical protein
VPLDPPPPKLPPPPENLPGPAKHSALPASATSHCRGRAPQAIGRESQAGGEQERTRRLRPPERRRLPRVRTVPGSPSGRGRRRRQRGGRPRRAGPGARSERTRAPAAPRAEAWPTDRGTGSSFPSEHRWHRQPRDSRPPRHRKPSRIDAHGERTGRAGENRKRHFNSSTRHHAGAETRHDLMGRGSVSWSAPSNRGSLPSFDYGAGSTGDLTGRRFAGKSGSAAPACA